MTTTLPDDAAKAVEAMMTVLVDVLADPEWMAEVAAAAVVAERDLSRTAPDSDARMTLWRALTRKDAP